MTEPIWLSGEPQNLEAAALDALEWLRYMRGRAEIKPGDVARLHRAIAALESFMEPVLVGPVGDDE